MAGRYSKFYSNYIFRKKHQNVNKGTIWERDWVTIGAQHQIEKGKRPFFGDSGFLYTINNIPSTKKRHNYGQWVASWLYPDVENAKPVVNSVEVNYLSNDIRDFVYYGSCSELIRTSIMDIISGYPAILSTEEPPKPFKFYRKDDSITYEVESPGLKIQNYFNVDLIHKDISDNNVNLNRFLAISYPNFNIRIKVKTQTIDEVFYFDEIYEYTIIQNAYYNKKSGFGLTQDSYDRLQPPQLKESYEEIDYSLPLICNVGINTTDIILKAYNSETPNQELEIVLKGYYFEEGYVFCLNSGVIRTGGETPQTYGFNYSTNVTPTFNAVTITPEEFYIYPKKDVVENFFDNLNSFQKLLLRTDTKPLYKNTFLTPYETDYGYYYVYVDYVWPSKNGIIDINSPLYIDYITSLYELGEKLDELWCDNLWRNMTHESIKNYDWTYTRTFIEGDEEENIIGGRRVENLIRIYGMIFDDIKRYIDGIKLSQRVTYDSFNNMPDAELSDKLDYLGWDIFSTIPSLYGGEDLDTAIPNSFVIVNKEDNSEEITVEEYSSLTDEEKEKYEFKSADLSTIVLEPVGEWFYSINPNNITPLFMDNHFMRQLVLSTKHIMKTKGTINAIEMVMALFGLGNDNGDDFFEITERYHHTTPEVFEEELANHINKLNHRESANYDEDLYYEGIPLENVEKYNTKYIVPFYNSKKQYRGEFTFQSKGGWGSDSLVLQNAHFKETLSYLKVAGNITDLLSLNPYDVNNGDIYYVIDMSDVIKYDETIDEETIGSMTHFYLCNNDIFTEQYSSWTNILVDDALYKKAMYLYNIISTDIGNNPHVGYGEYDLGQNYLEYMTNPFKYDLDNYILDDDVSSDMWSVEFSMEDRDTEDITEKVKNEVSKGDLLLRHHYDDGKNKIRVVENRDRFFSSLLREKKQKQDYLEEHLFDIDAVERQEITNRIADINAILSSVEYYLNDKVFVITNKIRVDDKTPETYKKYFFDVILQYLMQVIPSTAILVLKDFD